MPDAAKPSLVFPTRTAEESERVGMRLARHVAAALDGDGEVRGFTVGLIGPLGAGKTQFSRGFVRGVDEDGSILVRPDKIIAWRSTGLVDDPRAALTAALDAVLSRS